MLSSDDLGDFHSWYRLAYAVRPDPQPSGDDIVLPVPRDDALDVEDDLLIADWRSLKQNPQKCCREWVLNGAPAEPTSAEHFQITERLAPWRNAYCAATPERQESIRRWLERQ